MGQDMLKGAAPKLKFINGHIVNKGRADSALMLPCNARSHQVVKRRRAPRACRYQLNNLRERVNVKPFLDARDLPEAIHRRRPRMGRPLVRRPGDHRHWRRGLSDATRSASSFPLRGRGPPTWSARIVANIWPTSSASRFSSTNARRGSARETIGIQIVAAAANGPGRLLRCVERHAIRSARGSAQQVSLPRVKLDVNARFAQISEIVPRYPLLPSTPPRCHMRRNLREFIALLKANRAKYRYGSSGLWRHHASSGRAVWFHVRARGGSWSLQRRRAVDGGPARGPHSFHGGPAFPALLPHIRSGELLAFWCVNADHRLALLPDVPTAAEAGLPGYKTYNWPAFAIAPLGTRSTDRQAPQRTRWQKA